VDGGGEMPQRKWLTSREKREAKPDAKPTWAETLRGEALFGVAPVRAALLAKRRPKVYTLFVQDSVDAGRRKEGGGGLADLVARATALGAAVQQVDKHELNLLTENRNHQGVVLDAAPLEPEEVDVLPQMDDVTAAPPVWVALDQVSDPQNLGAILRSALFLGAAGVVVAQRNSAPLSPVVSKASAGAMEVLPVHVVSGNMPQFLAASSANGWTVLGADMGDAPGDARVVPCSDVVVEGPTILVLGSEGEGLRTNVLRVCDRLVCVPRGAGDVDDTAVEARAFVDSLNVSVAAGVVLHSLLHSRKKQ
jgi:21S rRNA (GM2251-2'-O)-methyltransferase